MDRTFGGERRELIGGETPAPRVRQQPVETTGEVGQVKSYRGSAPRPSPELFRRQALNDRYDIFSDLHQGVGGGLEERRNAVDGTAEPDFWRLRHAGNLVDNDTVTSRHCP